MTIAQSPAAVPFAELDALTIGTVAVPGDTAYDALVSPWTSSAVYLSMAYEAAARRGWSPAAYERLQRIRRAADPEGLFVPPQRGPDH